jgi:hypothetical protein
MQRLSPILIAALLLVLAFVAGGRAAAKSYQFTGVVKAASADSLTVEKSAKETWQFEVSKDTKGVTPKAGDRITVFYKMVAVEIQANPATAPTKTSAGSAKPKK